MVQAAMTRPEIDIIIPCFNQPEMTAACLGSIQKSLGETSAGFVRTILIDNGSSEASVDVYRAGLDPLHHVYLRMPENLGFVKATNAGIAVSTAPFVLFLNNDTELPRGWVDAFSEVLAKEPEVGIVGPLSSSKHQWQGQVKAFKGWRILGKHNMLSFFCALLRRSVIEKCGYLSEEYRAGLGDDDDYCAAAHKAEFRLALRGDITVVHHHRTTFRDVYGEGGWVAMQEQNIDHFYEKWKPQHAPLRRRH